MAVDCENGYKNEELCNALNCSYDKSDGECLLEEVMKYKELGKKVNVDAIQNRIELDKGLRKKMEDKNVIQDGQWKDLYTVGDGCISLSNDPEKCCANSKCGLNITKNNFKTCRRKDFFAKNNMNNSC